MVIIREQMELKHRGNRRILIFMSAITLKAHFDGQRIVLDEPFELPKNSPLMVTVLSPADGTERAEWSSASAAGLARAYADDEPDYSLADVKT